VVNTPSSARAPLWLEGVRVRLPDELRSGRRERPALVWLITVICIAGAAVPWLTYLLVSSGVLPLTAAARAYFARSATSYYAFSAIHSAGTVAAAVCLFALKRSALYLFVLTLALYLLSIWLFQRPELEAGLGSYANAQEFTKFAFQIAVIYYCGRLLRRGVLA
jgi:hypothetical protein